MKKGFQNDKILSPLLELKSSHSALANGVLTSSSNLASFILRYVDATPDFITGLKYGLSANKTTPSPKNVAEINGVIIALGYTRGEELRYQGAAEAVEQLVASITIANNNYSTLNAKYSASFDEQEQKLHSIVDQTNEHFTSLAEQTEAQNKSALARLSELEALYEEKLKLQAPAQYWAEMEKSYTKSGRWWLFGSMALSALIMVGLFIFAFSLLPADLGLEENWTYDLRLMAECIYASKFINEGHAKRLVNVLCTFGSDYYGDKIRHDAFLVDRVKTNSKTVLRNISIIRTAMSPTLNGQAHRPEKIRFKYLQHSINDVKNEVERRQGKPYIVNPFCLMINEGNYYLLTIDDKTKKPRPYRVDRMKYVELTGIERECEEEFKKLDMKVFAKRTFSMFSGNTTLVEIHFLFLLLDTMVERFGTEGVTYSKIDDKFYSLSAFVDVSEQFYGWLLGFGRRVKLVGNEEAVKKFNAYLTKIYKEYNPDPVADE